MKMSQKPIKSGGASSSHRAQGNLGRESKTRGVSEPPATSGLNPEGQQAIVSKLSGVPSLSPGGGGQVMLPGALTSSSELLLWSKKLHGGAGGSDVGYVATINSQLRALKLPFICDLDTPGDGNCFFMASFSSCKGMRLRIVCVTPFTN